MSVKYERKDLGGGIHYSVILDKRYKTNFFTVMLVTQLNKENAAANALIPTIISKSCESFPSKTDFNRMLTELYGASVYGSCGKRGDSQIVSISGSTIGDRYALNGEKITERLIDTILECVTRPALENGAFPEKDFSLKCSELTDDILTEINDKRSYAFKRASEIIYENEPSAVSVKGTVEDVKKLTPESVYKAYLKLLETAEIEIIYAGEETPENAEEKIRSAFSAAERHPIKNEKALPSPLKSEVRYAEDKLDIIQCKMIMAYKYNCDDFYAMRLMNHVLGGTPVSKLFANVREKLSLCYYCSSSPNFQKKTLFIDSGVDAANTDAARNEIQHQIDEMRSGNISESEIENAKLSIKNLLKSNSDSPRAITLWYFGQIMRGTSDSPEDESEKIGRVSAEDIINAAKSLSLDTVYLLKGLDDSAPERNDDKE